MPQLKHTVPAAEIDRVFAIREKRQRELLADPTTHRVWRESAQIVLALLSALRVELSVPPKPETDS